MRVSAVAKTIVALIGAAVAVATPLIGDGLITATDGVQIAIAVLTALGVFTVPNAPTTFHSLPVDNDPGEHRRPEGGAL